MRAIQARGKKMEWVEGKPKCNPRDQGQHPTMEETNPHFSHQVVAKRRKDRKTEPWALAHGPAG